MTLFFDVLLDDFVGDVPRTDTEVSARPHVAAPELLPQMWKLLHQLVAALAFQHLEQSRNRQAWRHAHEEVDVVARYMTFHDGDFVSAADFADQFSESRTYFTSHHWFTILRDPDDVQVDAKNSVRAVPIFGHGVRLYHARENLLKSSPKGEGFNPPRWRQ